MGEAVHNRKERQIERETGKELGTKRERDKLEGRIRVP